MTSAAGATDASRSAVKGRLVVSAARGWISTPYHHQASVRGIGTDCLGLIRGVYREVIGIEPEQAPGYSPDWGEVGADECLLQAAERNLDCAQRTSIEAGDVVVFRIRGGAIAKHAAIATSQSTMVHAVERVGTVEVPINSWWRRRLVAVFTFPDVVDNKRD